MTDEGITAHPQVSLTLGGGPVSEPDHEWTVETVRWMLGLDAGPAPVEWLAEQEPRFAPFARTLTGFRAPCFPDLRETCLSVIPFQQISLAAGTAIPGRIVEGWGGGGD